MDDVVVRDTLGIEPIERETIRRAAWRLLPLLMLGYACAAIDRVNVGMAALTMNNQLHFSNAVFGFGSGLFFFGYFLAEVPSNLMVNKVGARRWFARILVSWGLASGLTAFVWNDWSFYVVRFILGLAEAGFFPGVLLYLTWWFPSYYRSRMMAIFLSANMVSMIIGMPLGGLLLRMDGFLGLFGWQWLFIVEALPPIVLSVVMWQMLTDRPAEAEWLRPEQRAWLTGRLASERAQREAIHKYTLAEVFSNPKMWVLTVAWVGHQLSLYGLLIFLPLIIRGLGVPTNMVGNVSTVPFVFALLSMIFWGWHSDRTGERVWHAAGAWLLASAGMAACSIIGVGHPVVTIVALTLSAMGSWCLAPVFWSLPSAMLTGTAAAGGLAMIASIGQLGGGVGPWVFGLVKDATGSDNIALLCIALAPAISAVLIIFAGHDRRLERIPPRR